MRKHISVLAAGAALTLVLGTAAVATATTTTTVPSGQRQLGQSIVEPVYNAANAGEIGFIKSPPNSAVQADPQAWAPLYLPVYPTGSTVGALICPHIPVDTCPDHGPTIAGLAQAVVPAVYGDGVIGHDHLTAFRGGSGFHVALEPIVVLFTTKAAANEHILTTEAIQAAVARGDAVTVPLPQAALQGEEVPFKIWSLAKPVA